MHSQSTRDNSQGVCRLGKAPHSPCPSPGHLLPGVGWRMRLGPREHRLALAVPSTPCGEGHAIWQRPASSGLKARLEAAVTSNLCNFSAPFLLIRIRPHISALNWLRDAEQGLPFAVPHFPYLCDDVGGGVSERWG